MSIVEIIVLTVKASLVITVFALGLLVIPRDLLSVFRRPWVLVRSLVSVFGVMLAAALAIDWLIHPPRAVMAVIIALALAPIPPILPNKQIKAGGDTVHIVGLLVACSLFALVWIPLAANLLDGVLGIDVLFPLGKVAGLLFTIILLPLAAGALVRRFAPDLAERIQPILSKAGMILLVLAALPILIKLWKPTLGLIGDGSLIALVLFLLVGLAAGLALGGPEPERRTALALATACRHPGIALSLASLNLAGDKTVAPAVLLYLLVSTIAGIPFVAWRKRIGAAQTLKAP